MRGFSGGWFTVALAGGCAWAQATDFSAQEGVVRQAEVNGETVVFRAFEGIVYVEHPVEADFQRMNVYVPEVYFNGGNVEGFTAQTAPVFLPNQIGGYMPAEPGVPGMDKRSNAPNALLVALSKGYVVASPGARGRTSPTGKAPAAIVDLKAAVRYLHAHDAQMPGDATKIIASGTSAGGALAALLGASGDSADFEPQLRALGAAEASDAVFAVSSYCPITLLDVADSAYEWQFNGVNDYDKIQVSQLDYARKRETVHGVLSAAEMAVSDRLRQDFPGYVNGLQLKDDTGKVLTLEADGSGSFRDYVAGFLAASAQQALADGADASALHARGWLQLDGNFAGNHVATVDFAAYARAAGRQKTPPAFDALDLSSGENQLFGTDTADAQHFTDFSAHNNTADNATRADAAIVKMMNPLTYVDAPGVRTAHHWRIRHGTADRDTSLAVPVILATRLRNSGKTVDFFMPWDQGHGGDYDLEALFAWMKTISTAQEDDK